MKNPDYIHISLKPIITIGIILFTLIISGFGIDQIRSYNKLKRIRAHAQRVLEAHQPEIIRVFRNPSELEKSLKSINRPEKGMYQVSLLTTSVKPWRLYTFYYSNESYEVDSVTEDLINKEIKKDRVISSLKGQTILPNLLQYGQKQLILVGLPVDDGEENLGYLFLSVNKTTNLD